MENNFWIDRWEKKEIGFHNTAFHPLLTKHFEKISFKKGESVFIPLCGKTLDIHWLCQQGLTVIGNELVEMAVIDFFKEMNISPTVISIKDFKIYTGPQIKIFVGDLFKLQSEHLQNINYIFDRGALVALPEKMRFQYSEHLKKIAPNAHHFLITFDYDQSKVSGPPFSISADEINQHYQSYEQSLVESTPLQMGMKGVTPATENAWILLKKFKT